MEDEFTYVSALAWVSRGFAKAVPKQVEMTLEEADQIKSLPAVKNKYSVAHAACTGTSRTSTKSTSRRRARGCPPSLRS